MSTSASQKNSRSWAEIYPDIAKTDVLTADCYSADAFRRECDLIFRRAWLYAGRALDIPAVGDYLVREFPALKSSIILVRGETLKIRGFYNACRHRGAKLLPENASGCANKIRCEFHGWTYGTDGTLLSIPDPDGILNKDDFRLVPIATDSWNGFVFVNFDPQPLQTLTAHLDGLATHPINKFPFQNDWESWAWQVEVKANWKVVKDLFLETYHVAFVHKTSVHKLYTVPTNPYIHFPVIKFYGPNHHVSGPGSKNPTGARGLVGELSVKHGGAKNSRFGKDKSAAPGVNPENIEDWSLDSYGIFPNFHLNIFGMLWHHFIFEPIDENRTLWENRIYFPKAANAGERFAHEFSQSLQMSIGLEDMSAAERNQAGLVSGAIPKLAIHDQEIAIRHLRKSMQEFMATQTARSA